MYLLPCIQRVVHPVHLNGERLALVLVEEGHELVPVEDVGVARDRDVMELFQSLLDSMRSQTGCSISKRST